MSKKNNERAGRYEMPEEYKAVMDALADFDRKLSDLINNERDRFYKDDRNFNDIDGMTKPLWDASEKIEEAVTCLMQYGAKLVEDGYYRRLYRERPTDTQTDTQK